MNLFNYILELLIIMSIVCCLTVITSTNPVIAIIYLIGVFLNAAIYLIFIGLGFIGLSYIIVYIGAITVLFLFVIMMLNTDILDIVEIGPEYGKNLPLAYTISIFFFFFFIILIPGSFLINKLGLDSGTATVLGFDSYNLEIFNFYNNLIYKNNINSITEDQNNVLNIYNSIVDSNLIYNFSTNSGLEQLSQQANITSPNLNLDSSIISILQIETLGILLYSQGAILLIITSFILLLALVTPIILNKKNELN